MTINIEELTLKQIRELAALAGTSTAGACVPPFPVGTEVYARTVAYHCCGRIREVRGQWLILEDASYIGTDGRYSVATSEGLDKAPNVEIERVGNGGVLAVNMESIGDVAIHPGGLPKATKG